jgi:hypothetical protein
MDEHKLGAVMQHLDEAFPGCDIVETHSFGADAMSFKIAHYSGSLLLRVSDKFLDNNDSERITEFLRQSDVTNLLVQHPNLGVLITNDGATYFDRS